MVKKQTQNIKGRLLGFLAFALITVIVIPFGHGQTDGKGKAEDAPKVTVERGAGGKKVFKITTGFVIEGRIQKPNAFYVLDRSQINYDWVDLKRDFIPRITESVSNSPF